MKTAKVEKQLARKCKQVKGEDGTKCKAAVKGALNQRKGLMNAAYSDSTDSSSDLLHQMIGARKQRKGSMSYQLPELKKQRRGSDSIDSSSYFKLQCQLPAQCHEASETDDDDDVLCAVCDSREPQDCSAKSIYWVECERCDSWVHSFCAFGTNTAHSHSQYICQECSQ